MQLKISSDLLTLQLPRQNEENTWQGRQGLNLRHPVLETGALPTELLPYIFKQRLAIETAAQ